MTDTFFQNTIDSLFKYKLSTKVYNFWIIRPKTLKSINLEEFFPMYKSEQLKKTFCREN